MAKIEDRNKAIQLRKEGKTYGEILKEIDVSKSTLSLWLRSVGLAKKQKQLITEKRRAAQQKGAAVRRTQRIQKTETILQEARGEIGEMSARELLQAGAILYWAEGNKEKEYKHGSGMDFANTDPRMISFYIRWLKVCCSVPESDIYAHLYIHEYQKKQVKKAVEFWSEMSGLPPSKITGIYFKRHNPKTKRHNYNENYYGTLRVRVRRSSGLVRRIQGLVEGMCLYNWGIV